ncbi:ionotropic receptor 93a-like [Anopheles aquasalis]|uniref:ionotropic receptor 93a-like n=1 Tax=Anopheles aquasalis TaxID=42839 RepID=UPI00215A2000|nr:ionotropic receptor 93a-like [Anopheles aquasalis]
MAIENSENNIQRIPNPSSVKLSSSISSSSSSSSLPPASSPASSDADNDRVIKTRDLYRSGHLPDATCVKKLCPSNGTDVTLLILVTSAPTHREQRLAIRQSWGYYGSRRDISIGFIVGQTDESRIEDQLAAESYMYSDLIRGNFIDSYKNLTLKTISLLEWTKLHCSNASFLLKTDDDMFINVPKLLQFMEVHNNQRRTIFGRLAKKWKPIRNKKSKYYVSPEQYYPPVFPPFTTGPAYLLTADIISELFEKSLSQTYLKLEDVYTTGIVAQLLNIRRTNVKEFLNRRIAFNQCSCDDFPSLLSSNASIAIILDREYLGEQYEHTLDETKTLVEKLIRENLKNGGLIVKYFSWASINLKRDFTAVISVSNCDNTWAIYQAAAQERLVMLSITDSDCPRLPSNNAIMIPHSDGTASAFEEISQIILDMKSSRAIDWQTATLLYDHMFDYDISRCILSLLEDREGMRSLSLTEFKIHSPVQSWEKRKEIRRTLLGIPTAYTGRNFIAIVSVPTLTLLMEISKDLKLVNPSSQWLYLLPVTDANDASFTSTSTIINEGDNVAFVYNTEHKSTNCTANILCYMESFLLHFIRSLSKLIREEQVVFGQISDEEWEIIRPSKAERKKKMLQMIQSAITGHDECNRCSKWKVQSAETWGYIYRTDYAVENTTSRARKKYTLLDIGYWSPQDGFVLQDALFPHTRYGFRGSQLLFYSYHNPPWQFVSYNESGSPVIRGGVVFDVLAELSRKLNFTYTLLIAQGAAEQNGSLAEENSTRIYETGGSTSDIPQEIYSSLIDNKILLAAIGSTVTEKRKKQISFTDPISIQTYSFVISRPRELSRVLLFLSPFGSDTWLCLTAAVALMGPILCIINRLSPYYQVHRTPSTTGLGKVNNCFWYIYGALLQQGGLYLPYADSGRIIIGTWWLVVLVIVTTYCGNLVAFLTFPKIDIPVNRVMQLLRNERGMTWSIRKGTFLEEVLMESDESKYMELYRGSQIVGELTDELVGRIEAGQHVHIDWRNNLKYLIKEQFLATDRCDFALSTDEFLDEQIALVMPKDSPYLELVNDEIRRMHQFGFIQRWISQYLPSKDRCSGTSSRAMDVQNHTVNSSDMAGSYWILLLGFSGGLLFFVAEYALHWYRERRLAKATVASYSS